ncbi:type VII secretion target [Mycolicibacterium psychrotolerans]|uniref:type VII secretion target n=1 Tax=Mycolicibacterium psychrotolerans TaxID=216929 RepID=UPI003D66A561
MGNTRVDCAGLRAAAQHFDSTAEMLDGVLHGQLSRLHFDGAVAGRAHVAHGDAVQAALDRLAAAVTQWSRAAEETAVALRVTADRYGDADVRAAAL